jgi:hypothetical protein
MLNPETSRFICQILAPETHQHWSPAGASYCYSLLFDPDATIGIDLRERLFLLVIGRGE